RREIYERYHELVPLIQKLNDLKNSRQQQDEHIELLTYHKQEIDDAAISADEDTQLKEELSRLKHAEMLYQTACGGVETLYSRDGAVAERLSEVCKSLDKAAAIDSQLAGASETLADIAVRIEDVADQLRTYSDNINVDDRRLEEVESRLDFLTRLKRKYGGSLEAIFAYREKIEQDLSDLENLSDAIADTEKALETKKAHIVGLCRTLSQHRRNAADQLCRKIETALHSLKMKNTRFSVVFEDIPANQAQSPYLCVDETGISETGMERAKFMIAPNPGEELRPLSAIASGGELSRVILGLKAIMADTDTPSTLIFDEVDAGIGGEVAEMVGKKLTELAQLHQVICITHLAQIAKFGDHHHKISKETHARRTRTLIQELSHEDRVEETARMISGAEITQTTRQHAREMLSNRETSANVN
ncbi:MAG TPA: DNA repair protein RecN, partial [Desulfosalsimonadaceae bacterium]|nr:DNA repair protein RecN [Desulfosalsimonadaceae bacterium]